MSINANDEEQSQQAKKMGEKLERIQDGIEEGVCMKDGWNSYKK